MKIFDLSNFPGIKRHRHTGASAANRAEGTVKALRMAVALIGVLFTWTTALAQNLDQIGSQKPFTINGNFGVGLSTYNASGIPPRERSFSYLLNGSPVISIYGISFPFTVVVSDQQKGFRQPFNQYGISPQYKWITVHAGWQSITWSQFTLAGFNFLGGGVELNPGKLRLGVIYGRFNKAIESDTTVKSAFLQTPAYKRMGASGRLGYGTERNHIDFTFLKAKDDSTSLKHSPSSSEFAPAENLVVGVTTKFSFLKHFVWIIDAAGSAYTRNLLNHQVDSGVTKTVGFLKSLIPINSTTQFLTAGETKLTYSAPTYNIGVQYRRIDPDYKSMGAYYFETDVANYTIVGGLALFKSKLQINGSLGFQNDNLMHDKTVTSSRKISSLGASYNTPSYGADVRYSNYGITQDRGLNPLVDTFRVARTNYNFTGLLRYTKTSERFSNNVIAIVNLQSLADLNHFTAAQNKSQSVTGNLSYQLGLLKSGFNIGANYSYTTAEISDMHTIFYGPSLTASKQLYHNKILINATISRQQQENNNKDAGTVLNGTLNASYHFTKRDAMNLAFTYLKSNSKDATLPSFNEARTILNVVHSF